MKTKYFFLIFIFSLFYAGSIAQISSGKKTFRLDTRPALVIENLRFVDYNLNKVAESGEKCTLVFNVKNTGKGIAKSVSIQAVNQNFNSTSFSFEKTLLVGNIKAGETREVSFPINALTIHQNTMESFELVASEEFKVQSKPAIFKVELKAGVPETIVKWLNPIDQEITVLDNRFTLKACILSIDPLVNVEIFVNNNQLSLDRGFKLLKTTDCNNLLEQKLGLEEGDNLLQIIATTSSGKIKSETRNVILGQAPSERRLALVIGNSDYKVAPLRNPVNDANLMSNELQNLGFEVTTLRNASQGQIKQSISKFGEELAKDKKTVGLFYYAGHGIQIKGRNYLVPVDAAIDKEPDVEVYCVDLDGLLANLEYSGNNLNIIILDACRNNPYSRSFRSGSGTGLASVNAPVGTLLAYSTAPGSVAADGTGNNGLYTEEFVKAMKTPNMKIEDIFKKVRSQVKTLSGGSQIPWEHSSIEGDFYFIK